MPLKMTVEGDEYLAIYFDYGAMMVRANNNEIAYIEEDSNHCIVIDDSENFFEDCSTVVGIEYDYVGSSDLEGTLSCGGNGINTEASYNAVTGGNSGMFYLTKSNYKISISPYGSGAANSAWVSNSSNAGKFYQGTVNPSKDTRLNYNGYSTSRNPKSCSVFSMSAVATLCPVASVNVRLSSCFFVTTISATASG